MWFLFLCVIIGLLTLFCRVLIKSDTIIRVVVGLHILIAFVILGYFLGQGWQEMTNYGRYVRPFSEYSRHLRRLAESQNTTELTNAVIFFDSKFNARQDPKALQDAVWQILKVGPYYTDSVSNTEAVVTVTNTSIHH